MFDQDFVGLEAIGEFNRGIAKRRIFEAIADVYLDHDGGLQFPETQDQTIDHDAHALQPASAGQVRLRESVLDR